MKALVCTQCNSNQIVPTGDGYICEYCGTRYTDEQVRKMQIEGTVKIDNSEMVERFLQNARRAKSKEDWEETEKYYNMVEQHDPANIEAIFYSAYGKARSSLAVNELGKRQAVFKSLTNSVSIIDDNYDTQKEKELRPIIEQISNDIKNIYSASFMYTQTKNGYGVTGDDRNETYTLFHLLNKEFVNTLLEIVKKFPENKQLEVKYIYDIAISHCEVLAAQARSFGNAQPWRNKKVEILEEYNKYAKSEQLAQEINTMKEENAKKQKGNNIGGCILGVLAFAGVVALICWLIFG